jgi:hypothetical protein
MYLDVDRGRECQVEKAAVRGNLILPLSLGQDLLKLMESRRLIIVAHHIFNQAQVSVYVLLLPLEGREQLGVQLLRCHFCACIAINPDISR